MGQEVRGGTLRTSLTLTLALVVAAASEGTGGPLHPCGTSGGSDPGDDPVEVVNACYSSGSVFFRPWRISSVFFKQSVIPALGRGLGHG